MEVLTPKQAFGSLGHRYDSMTQRVQDQADALIAGVLDLLEPSSKVLDLGCATGMRTIHFANNGHRVTGIDIAEQMVEVARKNVPAATFLKMDMLDFQPAVQGEYDVVVAMYSLYYFPIPRLRNLLYKMSYAVKTGGIILILISRPAEETVHFNDDGWTEPVTRPFLGHTIQRIFGTMDAWKGVIEEAGLKVLKADQQRIDLGAAGGEQDVYISFAFMAQKVVKNALLSPHPLPDKPGVPMPIVPAWHNFMEHVVERADIGVIAQTIKNGAYQRVLAVGLGANDLCKTLQSSGEVSCAIPLEKHTPDGVLLSSCEDGYNAVAVLWSPMFVADPSKFLNELLSFTSPSGPALVAIGLPLHNAEVFNIADVTFTRGSRHHCGYLLKMAEKLLQNSGFPYIEYIPVDLVTSFPGMDSNAGIKEASGIIAECWFDADSEGMTTALAQSLTSFFSIRPGNIRCQTVILVAKRML